ncbi:MAG: phosphoribosylanthranilate isomerase [Syntrophales bacterium]|nr:phosphoribosylanthranilate isomerase [Syntrophales bacterium]MDD5233964.1 phosphoribosylanthranilate isomerase [Syntrophales bacterium]MDD5531667.1 phosphoribosylanthranilate isomerase [Syntrophales bacterium]
MIQVKICGMTNAEDALCAADLGADAVGFVFYPGSPRYILPDQARKICRRLPGHVARIGVFVNDAADDVNAVLAFCGLDFAQLHGSESPAYCRLLPPGKVIKTVTDGHLLPGIEDYPARAFLVDAHDPARHGGTGRIASWPLARHIAGRHLLILAGGLNERNIGSALQSVRADAVDIASGAEKSPGKKDKRKMEQIIETVRAFDPERNTPGLVFCRMAARKEEME